MNGGSIETIGENLEFGVTAASDVTVYFNGKDGTKTSADDSATEIFTDTYGSVKNYCLRCDQAVQIVSFNGVTLTDPISIPKVQSITENLDSGMIFKMVIRVITANTNIKLRVRGR